MPLKDIYEKHYLKLVEKLPMRDAKFLAGLTSAGLFAGGDLKDQVLAENTPAAKATVFLDSAIGPYMEEDDEDVEELLKLLKVMEKHGGIVKNLAGKIRADLPGVGPAPPAPPGDNGREDIIKIVMKNYQALTTLNPDSLLINLYTKDVITMDQKRIIDTNPLPSKKMEYILDEAIIPDLRAGLTTKFKGFLEAMEESEDTTINTVGGRLGNSADVA